MSDYFLFKQDLLLANLAKNNYPALNTYQKVKTIDLCELQKIDSAGVAYLVQIKTQYPTLLLINATDKLLVLAALYGVESFFEK